MNNNTIYIGDKKASFEAKKVEGNIINFDNENYYKISNSDAMRPFFMSIVSDSNHWMFISSNGGLSAGRKDSDSSLFPYYTDDKITESANLTGSKTIVQVHADGKTFLWEPLTNTYAGVYKTERNLYKNSLGDKVVFEEVNEDLGLTFRYAWNTSDQFGFVKKSTIINNTSKNIEVTILDGIQNLLPYGVSEDLQNKRSNLVDAYKKCELDENTGIGTYALSSMIVDKAEPSEALKGTIAWSTGITNAKYLVSSSQLDNFRKGIEIKQEVDVKAEKGAYFICADLTLKSESEQNWMILADVNQSMVTISKIAQLIKNEGDLSDSIQSDIELGSKKLLELNAASDALQLTADKLRNTRHFSNTLFNIMRGGIFDDGYQIEKWDFVKYLEIANKKVFKKKEELLNNLPEKFSLNHLKGLAEQDEDKNFKRLAIEYMPLKFSRRHGDPSRPWNKFSINTTSELDGSKILDYEGNWRDIFQNWEALAHSYPEFIESMIHKFLNATTFDGYNPYRVTKDGFDWETIEPDDPWSYIGYWGDHQIIYLLKFLEFIENHYPNKLAKYFNQDIFVYGNVPYRIKSYSDILINPKDTIDFDQESQEKIEQKRLELGADGALLRDKTYFIYKVNLIEKLLATVLAKLSNFIPEGGIWMNTQRPEWNDANNALVGNGVSMVTLYYLRRFLNFFEDVIKKSPLEENEVSKELVDFFNKVLSTFNENTHILSGKVSNTDRKTVLDALGIAGSDYRLNIYENGFSSDKGTISKKTLLQFLEISKKYLDHSIDANKRDDNLFHAYNLMTVDNESEVSISYLPEMLEGQVAVLSSGYISGDTSLEVLDALKASSLFRPDQYSYILYPDKELPRFDVKNNIASSKVEASALLTQLLKDKNKQIIEQDVQGRYHFNGTFNNADNLKAALSNLSQDTYGDLIEKESKQILNIFEDIFDHKAFTGRSGTFFGYEGLGSIYWHMVSKLLLSAQETCLLAIERGENEVTIGKLLDHYYEINEGIGVHKSPELYGAVPTDPYSHTPATKGAQQPGMTGQVKEDILSRFGELGVYVVGGKLLFNPRLLRIEEFLRKPKTLEYIDVNKESKRIELEKGSLCFTYCQVPIIYKLSDEEKLEVVFNENTTLEFDTLELDSQTSKKVFERTGEISQIIVYLKK
ncbi:hypothetical protein GCM10023311_15190 [Flaviramulus aquimarinus]|uniref:Cellobiose phosphorylase n=1 Tax=Flaviramulus aquimarinus TaxID=1170456 RepID=A0ABP9F3D8_9FLAO